MSSFSRAQARLAIRSRAKSTSHANSGKFALLIMAGNTQLLRVEDAILAINNIFQLVNFEETAGGLGLFAWPENPAGFTLILAQSRLDCEELIRLAALPQGGTARRHNKRPRTTERDLNP